MEKSVTVVTSLVLAFGIVLAASSCSSQVSFKPAGIPLPRFQSSDELVNAFRDGRERLNNWRWQDNVLSGATSDLGGKAESLPSHRYSATNVQVEGVDEADAVKTDGEFIYAVAGDSLCIVKAYPPQEMRLVLRISFGGDAAPTEMFVNGDRLAVIGYSYIDKTDLPQEEPDCHSGRQLTFLSVYDISDREDPRLLNTVEHEGFHLTSRMIGGDVHAVLASRPYMLWERGDPRPEELIPLYRTVRGGEEPGALVPACDWSEVECFEPEACSSFLSILSLSLEDDGGSVEKREIAGNAERVFASAENLYVTAAEWGPYPLPESDVVAPPAVTTDIHKFRFEGPSVSYIASGEVPGSVLDQFSMDEWNGHFRVATTGYGSGGFSETKNNVYVLDASLNVTGRLEGLAPGETIYAARFMGERGYLVTFETIDPLFVLDLANPASPRVLGELKIPGYSDYLHPYDGTHIIGVGKNAVEAEPSEGDFSWYQGIKIALFDVSDVSHPREMHKVEIGDRGTDSYALWDHKAFLFDRDRGILVLPILLAELTPEQKASGDAQTFDYGTYTYQGAYVYDLFPGGGFRLRGRVTHIDDPAELTGGGYYGDSGSYITRSLYIGDSLYTISASAVKANDLDTLGEQALVSLKR